MLALGVAMSVEVPGAGQSAQPPAASSNSRIVSDAGPRADIACPAGAIAVTPGTDIPSLVQQKDGNTTFCLKAGVHSIAAAIMPKSGDTFVGEYGAILDGSGWTTTDATQGAFRAHNVDVDDVTIRNLVIRRMPKRAIHAYYWMSDRWTIEHNELAYNGSGVALPNSSVARANYIHHSTGEGYSAFRASDVLFENNNIAFNGTQKVVAATNATFRGNFVHDNSDAAIWYDGDCTGGVVEGNTVQDNAGDGIFVEISSQVTVRNNTLRRNASSGIFISTSKNIETYNNTLEDNWRGIQYFLNCAVVGGGNNGWDLANNTAHDNTIKLGTTSGSFENSLTYTSSCPVEQVAPYLAGSKNLKFVNNRYFVPSTTARYLVWGINTFKTWSEWQALGNDKTGAYQGNNTYR